MGLGFETWIRDLDLEVGFGTGIGLDNISIYGGITVNCLFILIIIMEISTLLKDHFFFGSFLHENPLEYVIRKCPVKF